MTSRWPDTIAAVSATGTISAASTAPARPESAVHVGPTHGDEADLRGKKADPRRKHETMELEVER